MFEKIIEIKGEKTGPVSIILAGVHGDERCGVEAMGKVLKNLEIKKGRVLFGYGNPRAIAANRRFVESNLNRMFRENNLLSIKEKSSYEYRRARLLKKYLNQASALLDLHASSIPKSRSFAICEDNAKSIVEYLPADLIVSGFDAVEPGGTDYYMNKLGKIGICLEAGYGPDLKSVKIAEEGIYAFLKARGHLENNLVSRRQSRIRIYEKYYSKTANFFLTKSFENFEVVAENQIIGTDSKKKIRAAKRSLILFAHNCRKIGSEAFLLGE
ncbi:MAG: succinylglutamate desuccinylase/aspartoacylase family protein [bacterium]|nr:succinylglutamate desuccinylase/aspartoacylase family protein [bacterium]